MVDHDKAFRPPPLKRAVRIADCCGEFFRTQELVLIGHVGSVGCLSSTFQTSLP